MLEFYVNGLLNVNALYIVVELVSHSCLYHEQPTMQFDNSYVWCYKWDAIFTIRM